MWWRIAAALIGTALLMVSNLDRTRANPGRVLERFPNGWVAGFRRPVILAFLGFFLLVFGCASLQVVIGGWAFAAFAVLAAAAIAPVLLHNRAVHRGS